MSILPTKDSIPMIAQLVKYKNKEWVIYLVRSGTYLFAPKDTKINSYQRKKQLTERVNQLNKLKK